VNGPGTMQHVYTNVQRDCITILKTQTGRECEILLSTLLIPLESSVYDPNTSFGKNDDLCGNGLLPEADVVLVLKNLHERPADSRVHGRKDALLLDCAVKNLLNSDRAGNTD
jgi:hypothetical protein